MIDRAIFDRLETRMADAEKRYGPFASTHEAAGVMLEEWDELRAAIHLNALAAVQGECLDLAAVCIRLAQDLERKETSARSVK